MDRDIRLKNYRSPEIQIQPRGGRSTTLLQKNLLTKLAEAGANVLPITVDSNTRLEKYEKAEALYAHSLTHGVDSLNGFPFMAVPSDEIVEMISKFENPVSLRHGSPVAHKLVEKALLCGIDEIEGGPLTYSLPYTRNTSLAVSIESWKKVERMCASSKTRLNQGVLRESFGVLTAVLVPPYVALLVSFLEAIFSYSNGVRHFMIGLQSSGNLIQDIVQFDAARRVASSLAGAYFPDLHLYYAYHHWMGPFPRDSAQANSIIDICNLSAHLVKADKVVVKTNVEAYGVPSEESNAYAVRRTRKLLLLMASMDAADKSGTEEEVSFLTSEVLAGIHRILTSDSLDDSLIRAVESGQIDLMFSPHQAVRRRIEVYRDRKGWVRLFDPGELLVSREFQLFERRGTTEVFNRLTSKKILSDMLWPRKVNRHLAEEIANLRSHSGVDLYDG